jgi:hypothetical protein
LVDSELAAVVERADGVACRRAVYAGARLAVERTSLADKRAHDALLAIAAGELGDCVERREIGRLVEELDMEAWDLQEEAERGQDRREQYLVAFRKARAAASLQFAFEANARVAASEALYEAFHAIQDQSALRAAVVAAIG